MHSSHIRAQDSKNDDADLKSLFTHIEGADAGKILSLLKRNPKLIGKVSPFKEIYNGWTLLMVAAYSGNDEDSSPMAQIFEQMLEFESANQQKMVDKNIIEMTVTVKEDMHLGWNCAVMAVAGKNYKRLAMILERFPDLAKFIIQEGDERGSSLLISAANSTFEGKRHIETVRVILDALKKQNVEIAGYINVRMPQRVPADKYSGKSALDFAIEYLNIPLIQLLCDHGAKPFEVVNGKCSNDYLSELRQAGRKSRKRKMDDDIESIQRILESTRAPRNPLIDESKIENVCANILSEHSSKRRRLARNPTESTHQSKQGKSHSGNGTPGASSSSSSSSSASASRDNQQLARENNEKIAHENQQLAHENDEQIDMEAELQHPAAASASAMASPGMPPLESPPAAQGHSSPELEPLVLPAPAAHSNSSSAASLFELPAPAAQNQRSLQVAPLEMPALVAQGHSSPALEPLVSPAPRRNRNRLWKRLHSPVDTIPASLLDSPPLAAIDAKSAARETKLPHRAGFFPGAGVPNLNFTSPGFDCRTMSVKPVEKDVYEVLLKVRRVNPLQLQAPAALNNPLLQQPQPPAALEEDYDSPLPDNPIR